METTGAAEAWRAPHLAIRVFFEAFRTEAVAAVGGAPKGQGTDADGTVGVEGRWGDGDRVRRARTCESSQSEHALHCRCDDGHQGCGELGVLSPHHYSRGGRAAPATSAHKTSQPTPSIDPYPVVGRMADPIPAAPQAGIVSAQVWSAEAAAAHVPIAPCECEGECDGNECACGEKGSFLWQGFLFRGSPPRLTPLVIAREAAGAWAPTVFECTPGCPCPPTCPNRVVQHKDGAGVAANLSGTLVVFDRGPPVGAAVRTTAPLACGQFVAEYAGEVVTAADAAARRAAYKARGERNYVLASTEVRV